MSDYKDVLRIAKYIARYSREKEISEDSLILATSLFNFNLAGAPTSDSSPKNSEATNGLVAFGTAMLKAYPVMPAMQLTEAAKTLRDRYDKASGWTLKRTEEPSADQVKALQALLLKDWTAALESFKPQELEKAKAYAIEFKKAMPDGFGINKPIPPVSSNPNDTKPETLPQSQDQTASQVQPETKQADSEKISLRREDETRKIEVALKDHVRDQDAAVDELVKELRLREWGLAVEGRPAVFVLVGPAGTGKSLTAQTLAKTERWNEKTLVLNLASMRSRNEGFALTGLRHGYESAGPGRLTKFVRENPDALIVLENFTEAHPSVQDLLIPLLTEGQLTDEYGFGKEAKNGNPEYRTVSFQKATLLLTTRAGESVYRAASYRKRLATDRQSVIADLLANLESEQTLSDNSGPNNNSQGDEQSSALLKHLGSCCLLPYQPLGLQTLNSLAKEAMQILQRKLREGGEKVEVIFPGSSIEDIAISLALAQGPIIQAIEVKQAASKLLAPDLLRALNNQEIHRLEISVDGEGQRLLQNLGKDTELIQSGLFRRNQRLEFQIQHKIHPNDKSKICLYLTDLALKRVALKSDQEGDGGISMEVPEIRFDNISGHEHVKSRLSEVLALIRPQLGSGDKPKPPKGMLLYGRPGTGKTMLAKALACEAELPFIAVTGPQLLNMRTLRKVFRLARQYAPSLVFIDEIDALGVRGKGGQETYINQLLAEMDGFIESRDGHVFVVAATNFPQNVDPALTRSGRLDLHMEVPVLDKPARMHFLAKLTKVSKLDDAGLEYLASLTAGMSGADLDKFVREAELLKFRRPTAELSISDLLELLNVIKHGARLTASSHLLKEQLEATAYHEAGHAVASWVLNPNVRIQQVTIVPRGEALGFTAYDPESLQRHSFNRNEVMDLISVALAGRIAESKQFPGPTAKTTSTTTMGGPDSGASSDLHRATDLAWKAITQWGLDDEFGWMSFGALDKAPELWQSKAAHLTEEWLREAESATVQLMQHHWNKVDRLAKALLQQEVLFEADLNRLMNSSVDTQVRGV